MNNSSAQYGSSHRFRLPAEWSRQAAVWLAWPHNTDTWPLRLKEAQLEFAGLARTIAEVTTVRILGGGEGATGNAVRTFSSDSNIEVLDFKTNDAWIRDYGPTFVVTGDGSIAAVGWNYNAWGGKYPPFDDDRKVATAIASCIGIEFVSADLCFEGGAIEINDAGVLLSTRSCALDPNRNKDTGLKDFERAFADHLGARHTVWLTGDGIIGDDTDGHIDQLARFVDDSTIVYAWTDDDADPQHAPLKQNHDDLKAGLEAVAPTAYRTVPLPLPKKPVVLDGNRLPASYCNFLITNGTVIVPQFEDENDDAAVEILANLMPDHRVVGLASKHLSAGLGSFHCLSQQQPALRSNDQAGG